MFFFLEMHAKQQKTLEYLVDEQNGFRKKNRGCIDQIYTVSATVRTRIEERKFTLFCRFSKGI